MPIEIFQRRPAADSVAVGVPRKRSFWAVIGVALAICAALLGIALIGARQPQPLVAPDFTLNSYDGSTYRLSDLRGKVVVLNFWASWCAPCRTEAPTLEQLWQTLSGQNVIFLGIDQADPTDQGQAFLKQFAITYPNGPDNGIVDAYGVQGLPTTIIIDPAGNISSNVLSAVDPRDFLVRINQARNSLQRP